VGMEWKFYGVHIGAEISLGETEWDKPKCANTGGYGCNFYLNAGLPHLFKGLKTATTIVLCVSCNVKKNTYQSCDIEHCRCQVWQPASAKVVHCEVCRSLKKNQVQENEGEKSFARCKQLLQ